MADKNLVTNPDAVKPIDASKIKPDITVEFGNENDVEERYLFDLYQNLDKAEQSGDEAAQLKAFEALQNYIISQETTSDKLGILVNHYLKE